MKSKNSNKMLRIDVLIVQIILTKMYHNNCIFQFIYFLYLNFDDREYIFPSY